MKRINSLSWQIGASFIGTIIGAGFASGQEIMYFFTQYGTLGLICMLLSGAVFALLGYAIFFNSRALRAYNYSDFIVKICGKRIAVVYDVIISTFLFLGASIMFSGSGAVFRENFKVNAAFGIFVIAILSLLVVLRSVKGILNINTVIVPVLIGVIIAVFAYTINKTGIEPLAANLAQLNSSGTIKPIFSFIFYCCYNIVVSIGVLSAFAEDISDQSILRRGSIIGGLGLMILGLLQNLCLLLFVPGIFKYSIPMLHVVSRYGVLLRYSIALCIWCAVFSTAVANLFSLASRLSKNNPRSYSFYALLITAACIPLAFYDFKKLVAFFYPLFGALSIALIIMILVNYLRLGLRQSLRR